MYLPFDVYYEFTDVDVMYLMKVNDFSRDSDIIVGV